MSEDPFKNEELDFPIHCHFKIIANDSPGMLGALQSALLKVGVLTPVKEGNHSEKGNYITFNLELLVNSKEQMTEIDSCLRAVPGVKMVL